MIKAIIFDLDNRLAPADEIGRDLLEPMFVAIRLPNKGHLSAAILERAVAECWQDPGHAAGLRQRSRFPFPVWCGIEQHGNPARLRIETQPSAELIAIHHRHEHVGNHQIGGLSLDDGQSSRPSAASSSRCP
jgi:hypothetical protein